VEFTYTYIDRYMENKSCPSAIINIDINTLYMYICILIRKLQYISGNSVYLKKEVFGCIVNPIDIVFSGHHCTGV
jgi:hypothetical protein